MGNGLQNVKRNRNYSLDLLKLFSAFMIVCIHFKIYGKTGEFVTVLSRFAVPVFFMISGYYSLNDDLKKLKFKIWNIVKLYFCTVVLYFCFNVAVMLISGHFAEAKWYVSTYFRIRYILPFILFNESNTAMHLWFLGSLIYSYIIRYFVVRFKIKSSLVYTLSGVLLLINLAAGIGLSVLGIETPGFLLKNYVLRNFLFMGFPLFAFGQFIKEKEEVILKKVTGKIIALLVVLRMAEVFVMTETDCEKDLYVSSLVIGFALFITALKLKDRSYSPKITALSDASTNVYIIHVLVGNILAMTELENMMVYLYLKPVVVFVLSVIIYLIIKFIFSKFNNKIKEN